MNNDLTGIIDVAMIKENDDGSAVFAFDLSKDMQDALLRFGIVQAIKAGIEAAKEFHPDFKGETHETK